MKTHYVSIVEDFKARPKKRAVCGRFVLSWHYSDKPECKVCRMVLARKKAEAK